jgi:hypothetical protein
LTLPDTRKASGAEEKVAVQHQQQQQQTAPPRQNYHDAKMFVWLKLVRAQIAENNLVLD